MSARPSSERDRLRQDARREQNWTRWGPYLSERQWGTVREDYSPDGSCWSYFPHEHARSRAYRWGEDGLLGLCDRQGRLCFSFALWNERDPILKERLFGLTGPQGNHGEDVKEEYFYSDALPTASWLRGLYKYPQAEFPYERLVSENHGRDRRASEFELVDTGVFADGRYFDVDVTYAKAEPDDVCIRLIVHNRGPFAARLHVLPQLWFRNTWSWGLPEHEDYRTAARPRSSRPMDGVSGCSPSIAGSDGCRLVSLELVRPREGGCRRSTGCSVTTRPTLSGSGAVPATRSAFPKDGVQRPRRDAAAARR